DYFVESLVATLLQIVPSIVIILPFYGVFMAGFFFFMTKFHDGQSQPGAGLIIVLIGAAFLLAFLLMLVLLLVGILFTFTYPLIVDRKLSGLNAVKLSMRAGLANFWGLLG